MRTLHLCLQILLIGIVAMSCKNETPAGNTESIKEDPMEKLSSNESVGKIDETDFNWANKRAAGGEKDGILRMILTFDDGKSGVTMSLKSSKENIVGEHVVLNQTEIVDGKEVSLRLNERTEDSFNIYTSKACLSNEGHITITSYDTENKKVSGYYKGDACLVSNNTDTDKQKVTLSGAFKEISLVTLQW